MRTFNFNESENHFIILMVEHFFFSYFLYIISWLIFTFFPHDLVFASIQARAIPAKGNRTRRHLSQKFRQKQFIPEVLRCFREKGIFAWINPRPDLLSDIKSCVDNNTML